MKSNCHGHPHHSSIKVAAETVMEGGELMVDGPEVEELWLFPEEP